MEETEERGVIVSIWLYSETCSTPVRYSTEYGFVVRVLHTSINDRLIGWLVGRSIDPYAVGFIDWVIYRTSSYAFRGKSELFSV